MFRMSVAASSVEELSKKLLEIGNALSVVKQVPIVSNLDEIEEEDDDTQMELSTPSPIVPPQIVPPVVQETAQEEEETPEYDVRGVKWDARVHAATKAKTKKGEWRAKRGVDEDFLEQVEKENCVKQEEAAINPMTAYVPPPIPLHPGVVVPPVPGYVAPPPPVAAYVPPVPVNPPPPVNATPTYENFTIPSEQRPAHSFDTFKANLIPTLAKLVNEGKLTQAYVEQLKGYFNVKEIWLLNDTQIRELFENLAANGLVTKVG